jgi:hypothetical protein
LPLLSITATGGIPTEYPPKLLNASDAIKYPVIFLFIVYLSHILK